MNEVKRISVFMHGPNKMIDMVEVVHLDRVTAERDAFKETLDRWHELNLQREAKVEELQRRLTESTAAHEVAAQNHGALNTQIFKLEERLTAADERADVLEGLLQRVYDADLAARHQQPYNASKLMDEIEEVLCQVNKVKINIPEGWKLVPVKPTEEMIHAIALGVHRDITTTEVWQELLDCAPAFEQADATPEP